MTVVHRVASALAWCVAGVALCFVILAMFVIQPFLQRTDPDRRLVGRWFHGFGVFLVGVQPFVRVRFENRSTAPYTEPCIVVANLLAAAGMSTYLLRRHPTALSNLGRIWTDQE